MTGAQNYSGDNGHYAEDRVREREKERKQKRKEEGEREED